jgi:hypothetical protein
LDAEKEALRSQGILNRVNVAQYRAPKRSAIPRVDKDAISRNEAERDTRSTSRESVHASLPSGVLIEGIDKHDDGGMTPLMNAAAAYFLDGLTQLIAAGANVNLTDATEEGNTALIIASERGFYEVAEKLVDAFAHVEARNKFGKTALFAGAQGGYVEIVRYLLVKEANIEAAAAGGITPLMIACLRGHRDVVRLLLSHRAAVNSVNDKGESPLILAAISPLPTHMYSPTGSTAAPVATRAEVDASSVTLSSGPTPDEYDPCGVIRDLLAHEASIDHTDAKQSTALHHAAHRGLVSRVRCLVEAGADMNKRDKFGMTALELALV